VVVVWREVLLSGEPLSENPGAVAGGLLSLLFGTLFAVWITRIIEQSAGRRELIEQLEATRGETVLAPAVATRLVHRMRVPAEEALTGREIEVLELVARGSSNADVTARLFISEATVKTHLLHIFGKLGVDDRTAAVVSAMERGIIALPRRKA
jgi:DNA-binding NarL/FixJ family response regulator